MITARNPPHHATAADLAALPDDARAEIIDGDIVEKAAPGPDHGTAQLGLGAQLFQPFQRRAGNGGPGGWWLMTEVEVEYSEHQVYRHDLVGWRRERIPERPRERPVHARPDWVCEVLSASNATNDTVKKLRTLHRHGVPHCWLVDPERGTLSVLRWTAEGYLTALTAEQSEVVRAEPFDAIELRLPVVFGLD